MLWLTDGKENLIYI